MGRSYKKDQLNKENEREGKARQKEPVVQKAGSPQDEWSEKQRSDEGAYLPKTAAKNDN